MPLYVKDREVGELAERLATIENTTKTEVVRRALKASLARHARNADGPEITVEIANKVQKVMDYVDELHEKYPSDGPGLPVTREWIDSLYED